MRQYCYDCHADGATEGGLDLPKLDCDLDELSLFAKWERIHDRVARGEMPPKAADRPAEGERAAFAKALAAPLTMAHAARKGTVLRRLNRREYENTLNDLFGTKLQLAKRLPEDGRAHEFDNVGDALDVSSVQLQKYLECADAVLREVSTRSAPPPASKLVRASYAQTRDAEKWLGKLWLKRDDGAVVFFKAFGFPGGNLREANVARDGWYDVRVTGYAFQSDRPVTFSLGASTFARGAEQPTFGYFSFPPGGPTTITVRAWIPAKYMIEILPVGISDQNNEIRQKGVDGYQGPGLAIQSVEIEGPLPDENMARGENLLFAGLNRTEIPPKNERDRERPNFVPEFQIVSSNPALDTKPVLRRVASAAFRRPATAGQLAPYEALFAAELQGGAGLDEALRTAVSPILCAPEFLYLQERPLVPPGATARQKPGNFRLDDYSLAGRLSYFLTRTAPDEPLLAAAAAGQLTSASQALLEHVERLLSDSRLERFVVDFTDAWLNLRDIEFTNPDGVLYPEFDPYLQWSMLAETRSFFRILIDHNLGIRNLVKSDFAMLNERLAEHYGIAGVSGPEIRPVSLPAGSPRGGILSQASILKVSANGTNTSPVVRGVWVMERILGELPPPPPTGVPGVEPDIRGATTLRELLDKHRTLETCRACHQQIDPPGFALESFDPIGGWRERFRALGQGEPVARLVRGQKVRYKLGLPVDASGELPSGQAFAGFDEFRNLLVADEPRLARALVTKLLTFGTGREMGFSDRPEIDRIVQAASSSGYGLRDLVRLVVTSEIFLSK